MIETPLDRDPPPPPETPGQGPPFGQRPSPWTETAPRTEMTMESELTCFWELPVKVGEMTQFLKKSGNFVFGEKWH